LFCFKNYSVTFFLKILKILDLQPRICTSFPQLFLSKGQNNFRNKIPFLSPMSTKLPRIQKIFNAPSTYLWKSLHIQCIGLHQASHHQRQGHEQLKHHNHVHQHNVYWCKVCHLSYAIFNSRYRKSSNYVKIWIRKVTYL
jgi:hypothetical protein